MKPFLLFLFFGISLSVQSQDLTGIWRGNFYQGTGTASRLMEMLGAPEERYKFEVQLDQHGKQFNGVTYSYRTTVFYGKATCKGTVNPSTRGVLLEELKIVEVRMAGGSDACIMTLFLQYSKLGDDEFLEGKYFSTNTRDTSDCGRGTVFLRKVATSDFYKEPFLVEREKQRENAIVKKPPPVKKDPPVTKPVTDPKPKITSTPKKDNKKDNVVIRPPVTDPSTDIKIVPVDTVKKADDRLLPPLVTPQVLEARENELVKTIITDAREVTIKIYDNGAIDNDTISVYLDKKLVLDRQRLTEKALTLTVKLDETSAYHELVMVAENLGEIPPNTSLMIVHAGNKQYEVRITSTEQKNAVVIFKYRGLED